MTPQLQHVIQRPAEMTISMDQNLPILRLIILNAREWMTNLSIFAQKYLCKCENTYSILQNE